MAQAIDTTPEGEWVPADTFAARLVLLRHEKGWSQDQAAELCEVNSKTWHTWEHGTIPRNQAEICERIARKTGVNLGWLLYGVGKGAAGQPPIIHDVSAHDGGQLSMPFDAVEPNLMPLPGRDDPRWDTATEEAVRRLATGYWHSRPVESAAAL